MAKDKTDLLTNDSPWLKIFRAITIYNIHPNNINV